MDLKVHYHRWFFKPGLSKQTLKIMKLIAIILFAACIQVSARGYSQITLSETNAPLQKVFQKIQRQSGYDFVSTYETLNDAGNVTINVRNVSLQKALEECLKGKPLTYTIIGKTVVIQIKERSYNRLTTEAVLAHLASPPVEIHGRVTNNNGEPLQNVSVMIVGTKSGTTTDKDGRFILSVPDNSNIELEISSVGYQTKRIEVKNHSEISVVLQQDVTGLSNVVIIGYGSQKKKDLTGAISTVTSEDIRGIPVVSAQEAMQGKIPGVLVTQSSGSPGSPGVVHIRGIGSINGSNSPLYIVDGLPQNDVEWLSPNDIATISVLKDASSTAIYGARASNGVVIITTKKGKEDQPIRVSFDAYYGVQSPWKRPYMLNASDFIDYKIRAAKAAGATVPIEFSSPDSIKKVMDFVNVNTGSINGTDWWKEVTHYNAPIQNYNIGITGGSKNLSLASSLGYMNQDGIIKGSNYSRISWHNNIIVNISKRIKLSSNFSLIDENRQSTGEQNPWTGTVFLAQAVDPITPVYRNNLKDVPSFYNKIMDGYEANNPFSQYAGVLYTNKLNPVAQIDRLKQNTWEGLGIKGGAALDIKIINPLTFHSSLSLDLERSLSKGFTPSYFLNPNDFATLNTVSDNSTWSNYFVWDNILTYDKIWGNNHLTAMGGTSTELTKGITYAASIQNIVDNSTNMRIINAGSQNPGVSGYTYSNSLLSFFGRINYAFKDRYILTGNIRRDGSSNFGQGHQWGTFPSFAAAWRFSNEPFIEKAGLAWLEDAKLRVSYGLVGNQNVGSGAYLSTFGNTSRYLFGDVNSAYLGAGRTSVGNSDLQWETSKQLDIGLESTLFNDKLDFVVDYFNKRIGNMLLQLPLPTTLGYPNFPWVNAGSMVNKGWEFSVTHRNQIGQFKFSITGNISSFRNEVTSLGGGGAIYTTAHLGEVLTSTEVGKPVGYYFGWIADGIFQTQAEVDKSPQKGLSTPGDLRFKDINGTDANGNIVPIPDGQLNAADRTNIGNPWPNFIYGLTLNGSYKRFDLSIFFQGIQGNKDMNILRYDIESGTGWYNAPRGFLQKAWNGAGSTNEYYKISQNAALNTNVSSYYVEDGSYLRLKNVQIGYNFPESWLKKMGVPGLRIYIASQNLLTFTHYSGLDPEIGSTGIGSGTPVTGDPKLQGIDQGVYPQSRIFMFGINAQF